MKALAFAFLLLSLAQATAQPLRVVAAQSVYGDLAREIGGTRVEVKSLLTNPDQDPHLFEASPATARAIADASVLIINGAGYDDWARKLAAASPGKGRVELDVGRLAGAKPGANPHLWYSLPAMTATARALAQALAAADPTHAREYAANAEAFAQSLKPIEDTQASIRGRFAGAAIAATEPVFGYAAEAAGLDVREQGFALAVMNDTEPSPSDVAAFEADLKGRKVRALLYNAQASAPAVERLVALARSSGVPVVPVTETLPPGAHYRDWVKGQLDALETALAVKTN